MATDISQLKGIPKGSNSKPSSRKSPITLKLDPTDADVGGGYKRAFTCVGEGYMSDIMEQCGVGDALREGFIDAGIVHAVPHRRPPAGIAHAAQPS